WLSVAEFGGDVGLDRKAANLFEPIFRHAPGIVRGAAADQYGAVRGEIDAVEIGHFHALVESVDIARDGAASGFRLLVDFLLHEVAVVAFLYRRRAAAEHGDGAIHDAIARVDDLACAARQHRDIALIEVH